MDEETYAPVDASKANWYARRQYGFRKAAREGRQITIENVNDVATADLVGKLYDNDSIYLARAFTNNPELIGYSYLDYQVKANSVAEYIEALKNPDVDNVVFVGQDAATMPTFYYENGSWGIDSEGMTAEQRELAQTIAAEGLEMAYAMKSPIERTAENALYVSNRNAASRAMWEAVAEEKQEAQAQAEEAQGAQPIQYSLAEDEKSVLDKQDLARFYAAIGEMKIGKTAQFQKNADGLYMVAIDNKIVYTNGKWMKPSIEKVDVINGKTETEIEPIRDVIFFVEQMEGLDAEEVRRALSEVLQDGDFTRYGDGIRTSDIGGRNGQGEGSISDEIDRGTGRDAKPQYSIRFDEDERLNALINYARDNNASDLLAQTMQKRLGALFERQNTRTSFEQANPVRIMKELAAS